MGPTPLPSAPRFVLSFPKTPLPIAASTVADINAATESEPTLAEISTVWDDADPVPLPVTGSVHTPASTQPWAGALREHRPQQSGLRKRWG